jgi:hypothetical protein
VIRRAAVGCCVVAAALLVPAAGAQNGGFTAFALFGPTGGQLVASRDLPVTMTGELVVSFAGDQASGCASRGLCDYRGTVIVKPVSGEMFVATVRRHGRLSHVVELALIDIGTAAQVSRSGGAGRCADLGHPFAFPQLAVQGRNVQVALLQAGESLLATRCAGPLDADLAAAQPHLTVPLTELASGRRTLDLSGSTPFAANGLGGTVSSTIRIAIGKPAGSTKVRFPRGIKFKLQRFVSERLSVKLLRAPGRIRPTFRGAADPDVCALLDSCGVTGALSATPSFSGATAELVALGSAKHPMREFVAALHGKRVPGITLEGGVQWGPQGTLTESLNAPGWNCQDTAPLPGGGIILGPSRTGLTAAYFPDAPLRTRCPGPLLGPSAALATGHLARASLGHRSFVLAMKGIGTLSDDGYDVSIAAAFGIELRHGAVTQRVIRVPTS